MVAAHPSRQSTAHQGRPSPQSPARQSTASLQGHARQGLYDPRFEHDSCGVGFVCDISGSARHEIVALGLKALCNLEHRGALGADARTGDGAGMLIGIPDRFLRDAVSHALPPAGEYATGIGFFPQDPSEAAAAVEQVEQIVRQEGLEVIGWREVPVNASVLGASSRAAMPRFRQVFIADRGYGDRAGNASRDRAGNGNRGRAGHGNSAGGGNSGGNGNGSRLAGVHLDRRVWAARKRIEHEIGRPADGTEAMGAAAEKHRGVYFPSLSARTLVYKGMLTARQLTAFYADLTDERIESALVLVHSRFSTNTFPSWSLAHPFRFIAHNGEINAINGNRNWMRAREAMLASPHLEGLARALPVCTPGASDTASFDEVLELLVLGGYSMAEAVMMMIPEPWEHHNEMDPELRAFYRYNSTRMEPWDGPASIAFSDGVSIGAVLDRNGLRPSRYLVTSGGLAVMASETGVLDIPQSSVIEKGRLRPGRLFLIDTAEGRIVRDGEIKRRVAAARPYQTWLDENLVELRDLPRPPRRQPRRHETAGPGSLRATRGRSRRREVGANGRSAAPAAAGRDSNVVRQESADLDGDSGDTAPAARDSSLLRRQQVFGYTLEDLRILLAPMASTGKEALGSMGTDTPPAVLSQRGRLLFDYFKQIFAQVTNPPLDAIREELVTSMFARLGPEGNLLQPRPESCRTIHLDTPILTGSDFDRLAALGSAAESESGSGSEPESGSGSEPEPGSGRQSGRGPRRGDFSTTVIPALYPVAGGGAGLRTALAELQAQAADAVASGATVVVISDRGGDELNAPIPSLLAVSAVHHHLLSIRARTLAGLVAETGDAREVHHLCLLLGYGANAVHPYLALETITAMAAEGANGIDPAIRPSEARRNFAEAATAGILKVMSKMGISTAASYTAAQIFEAIGLNQEVVDEYFTGTASRIEGVGLDHLAEEVAARHRRAHPANPSRRAHRGLESGGEYQWRREGEHHLFNPETVFKLQHSTRAGRYDIFRQYTDGIDDQSKRLGTLRGLFRFRKGVRRPVPVDEVEPVSEIVRRFATGAMSYGSISAEAHETLAIAMNRIGGKSNTGEGGEDPERYRADPNGDSRRSAIKQVASARFGVTSEYLVNADDIQIKIAQGAKPGEGGQLPGHKVYPWIAKTRYSTPGVGLISPPPHHDIYSIEDLAQLIYDLKNANPAARIHVKLVAEAGVGTVAAGVSKAHADVVLISGHDGGTGASPLTSIKHSGVPWELGLAETQQTLLLNDLRDRIVVQVDGQLKTGRDVVVAALLGAEEFGFATAPLVVMGCVMMRVCHLDTCPVGVATQNPQLRRNFSGRAAFVVNFFEFVAAEVRELLAELGFRTLEQAVGRVEMLDYARAVDHWKAACLDLSPLLHQPELGPGAARHQRVEQDHDIGGALDQMLIQLAEGALSDGRSVTVDMPIRNVNRAAGTLLGSEVTRRHGAAGLPSDTIVISFTGSAGASFGAFLPSGITLRLEGDANDYVAKGLSGGRIVVRPPADAGFEAEHNVIAGNVIGYGATSGEMYLRGLVGERFCVRNSGATAVVEGVGDHGCEYMTGGRVVILGPVGRNFAAGMSGGIAYLYDPLGRLPGRCNMEMVELEKPDEADLEWVRDRVERHRHETGSRAAARLLADWSSAAEAFVKVMPTDYKRALEATSQARAAGADEVAAVMAYASG